MPHMQCTKAISMHVCKHFGMPSHRCMCVSFGDKTERSKRSGEETKQERSHSWTWGMRAEGRHVLDPFPIPTSSGRPPYAPPTTPTPHPLSVSELQPPVPKKTLGRQGLSECHCQRVDGDVGDCHFSRTRHRIPPLWSFRHGHRLLIHWGAPALGPVWPCEEWTDTAGWRTGLRISEAPGMELLLHPWIQHLTCIRRNICTI